MTYPKVWGDKQGNDVARIVGEAKVRALQNVDAPYLSASGPGFLSRKAGAFQDVTLYGRSESQQELAPNLISLGMGRDGGLSVYYMTLRNDKFKPVDGDLKRFRERPSSLGVGPAITAPVFYGLEQATLSMYAATGNVLLSGIVQGVKARRFTYLYPADDPGWVNFITGRPRTYAPTFHNWMQRFVRPSGGPGDPVAEDVALVPDTFVTSLPNDKGGSFSLVTYENIPWKKGVVAQLWSPKHYIEDIVMPPLPAPLKEGWEVFRDTTEVVATRQLAADWILVTLRSHYSERLGPQVGTFGENYIYDSQDYGRTWVRRDNTLFDIGSNRVPTGFIYGTWDAPWPTSIGETASYTPMPGTPDYCITHMALDDVGPDNERRNVMVKVFRDWSFEVICPHPGYEHYPGYVKHYPFCYDERLFDLTLKGARIFQALPNPKLKLTGHNTGYANASIHLFVSTDLGQTWSVKIVPHTEVLGETSESIDASVRQLGGVFPLGASTLGYIRYEPIALRHVLMVSKDLGDTWYDYAIVSEGVANGVGQIFYGGSGAVARRDHFTAALLPATQLPYEFVEPLLWRRDYRIEYTPDVWEPPE